MTAEAKTSRKGFSEFDARLLRFALFLYSGLVVCPIRFWPLADGSDSTWVFASNYAALRGLANGRDIFWTTARWVISCSPRI